MRWHGLKLPVVFLAFVCGLVLAFGGQWAYQKYNYQQPLNQMLAKSNLIDEYTLEKHDDQTVVKIKLSKNANNLMTAYQEIDQILSNLMGKTPYRIELISVPDASLEEAFYECQFIIYQAQVAANFPEVAAQVTASATRHGASGKVFVDENFIYIQLTKTDGHFLHKVIPRQIPAEVVLWQGGAGSVKRN
ncbi:hypothetical protein JCM39194_07550 [Desulfotomaculum varum]